MQRRRDDATGADFGDAEYKLAMARLEDPTPLPSGGSRAGQENFLSVKTGASSSPQLV